MFKNILLSLFLIFISFSLVACSQDNLNASSQAKSLNELEAVDKIEVYYFHSNFRCMACIYLQKYVEETINQHFQEELDNNIIEFKEINIELSHNKEIVNEFQARGSSLYIKAYHKKNSAIEEDVAVWRYLNNEDQFKSYLKNKLSNLLTN